MRMTAGARRSSCCVANLLSGAKDSFHVVASYSNGTFGLVSPVSKLGINSTVRITGKYSRSTTSYRSFRGFSGFLNFLAVPASGPFRICWRRARGGGGGMDVICFVVTVFILSVVVITEVRPGARGPATTNLRSFDFPSTTRHPVRILTNAQEVSKPGIL